MKATRFPTPHALAKRYGVTPSEARRIMRDGMRAASRRLWPLTLGLVGLSLYALWANLSGRETAGLGFMAVFLGLCAVHLWLTLRLAAPAIDAAARFARH